eukprot:TRINITY_DN7691_c0_g1_i1.p1 TRINITY_DN7691_c0_g1~~TRINITY_DN7691_c0_g1_i1.p1  ORF type:complete len:240 (-),score=30.38 TRINITY_DN7691_c0_g1_i1:12-731(-)
MNSIFILSLISLVAYSRASAQYPYGAVFSFSDTDCTNLFFTEAVALDTCFYNATYSFNQTSNELYFYSYSTDDCSGPAIPSQNHTLKAGQCLTDGNNTGSFFVWVLDSYPEILPGLYTSEVWTGRDRSACNVNAEAAVVQYSNACQSYSDSNLSFYYSCSSGSPIQYVCNDSMCGNCTTTELPSTRCQPEDKQEEYYISTYCSSTPSVQINGKMSMISEQKTISVDKKGLKLPFSFFQL